jgi:hypothetical protein
MTTQPDYVYFIAKPYQPHEAISIKIGYSKHPTKRLRQLQTGNDCKLELIHTITCVRYSGKAVEQRLHSMLFGRKARGEWFVVSPDLLDWLLTFDNELGIYGVPMLL